MFPIWVNDGTTEMPTDPIFYVVAKDGIYLKKTMGHFDTVSKVQGISILGECETFAILHIAKIPKRKFAQILSLFRAVYQKYKSEVNVILHYNIKRKRFRIDIPPQGVTGASVNYENGLESYKGYTRIGTIHSHANMSAFHSGTDQGDEEGWDGLHITLGKIGEDYFDISCSVMSNNQRFMVNPEDYIEGVTLIEYEVEEKYPSYRYIQGVKELMEPTKKLGWSMDANEKDYIFPGKWMDMIDKYKPKPKSMPYFQGGFQHGAHRGYFNSLSQFYNFHNPVAGEGVNANRELSRKSYFEELGNDFEVDAGEWSPCAQCPYKNHKSEILMKDVMAAILDAEEDEAAAMQEDLMDEINKQNAIDKVMGGSDVDDEDLNETIYDSDVDRRSPFYVDDKEVPFGTNREKRKE